MASLFIVGDLIGGGIVAMPVSFSDTGFTVGAIFIILICVIFTITGWLLADTWEIMRKRWPEYKKHCRTPYSEMARRCMNDTAVVVTKITVHSTLFGATVVYILLSSKIFQNFMAYFDLKVGFCWLPIVVTASVLPATFLKSPSDYWWTVVLGVVFTVACVLLILVGAVLDTPYCFREAYYPNISMKALLGLSIFLFAYNGHQIFPTVQNDMRHPKHFKKSVIVGFLLVAILYIPMSFYTFMVYGNSMVDSVINSIQIVWIRYSADMLLALLCILTIIIAINPVNLQLEDTFSVPHKFCFKRVATRTSLMLVALFVGLTLPNFGAVMNLFGSTTVPCTCVILPTLFNLHIKSATYDAETNTWIIPPLSQVLRKTPKMTLIVLAIINGVTVICSVIATGMSVKEILGERFVPPCYLLPLFPASKVKRLSALTFHCCGRFMNISRSDISCGSVMYAFLSFAILCNTFFPQFLRQK
ncbi:unnamed protein product [Thelazia callipaeda]|uniref:Aa_trans domain-containing protein n=1 Tax=Thelazia callipaeda TaxID=103827 RepID=A0A0N5CVW8_THECL|nr:unnamed protein product [Thelazia callipaeda]